MLLIFDIAILSILAHILYLYERFDSYVNSLGYINISIYTSSWHLKFQTWCEFETCISNILGKLCESFKFIIQDFKFINYRYLSLKSD